MAENKIRVSIIGAGASGIISMSRLVENLSQNFPPRKKIEIFLFDKSGTFGPGLAYSTPLESHVINMRADTMSAVLDNPADFVAWLKSHELEIKKEFPDIAIDEKAYPPRKVYGQYLADICDKAFGNAKEQNIKWDGTQSTRLFAVGEMTRGLHFFTNAISQNARCAGRIAAYITDSINNLENSRFIAFHF